MTIHTAETLAALDDKALRRTYFETLGKRPGRGSRETMVARILEHQGEHEAGTEPEAATETTSEPQATTEPATPTEPTKVRVLGYGAYEGSEMTCTLIRRSPTIAQVQLVDARIKFDLTTGSIATKRKGWDATGWSLDLDSLPERGEWTESELEQVPLQELTTEQLQSLYERTLQRTTGSDNRGYLIWKIREARKGNIKVGPSERKSNPDAEMKVVPLRMEKSVVEALDEAWKRLGFTSRIGFIRAALAEKLVVEGEGEVAELIG